MKRKLFIPVMVILVFAILLPSAWAAAQEPKGAERVYSVLDPRGNNPPVPRVSLAARPASLNGKTLYVLSDEHFDFIMPWVAEELQKQVPSAKVVLRRVPEHGKKLADWDQAGPGGQAKDTVAKNANVVVHGTVH